MHGYPRHQRPETGLGDESVLLQERAPDLVTVVNETFGTRKELGAKRHIDQGFWQ
jgi:hypothetical protein